MRKNARGSYKEIFIIVGRSITRVADNSGSCHARKRCVTDLQGNATVQFSRHLPRLNKGLQQARGHSAPAMPLRGLHRFDLALVLLQMVQRTPARRFCSCPGRPKRDAKRTGGAEAQHLPGLGGKEPMRSGPRRPPDHWTAEKPAQRR